MPTVVLAAGSKGESKLYVESLERRGATVRVMLPDDWDGTTEALDGAGGLVLTGGADVDPTSYDQEIDPSAGTHTQPGRDEMELPLLQKALDLDMPVFAICRGMQLLNVAFGGSLVQDFPDHRVPREPGGPMVPAYHQVYVSPGSKLGSVLGAGMFYKVNSYHHQGVKEPQRSPRLLASAYHPDDGVIEGLESPEHSWVIGIQAHPEYEDQVAKSFLNLWDGFLQWAGSFEERGGFRS
jgi:putative glutamine amidotransferase